MTKDHGLPVAVTTADNVKALNSAVSLFSISRWPRSHRTVVRRECPEGGWRGAEAALKQLLEGPGHRQAWHILTKLGGDALTAA